jgi:hypothetical protein
MPHGASSATLVIPEESSVVEQQDDAEVSSSDSESVSGGDSSESEGDAEVRPSIGVSPSDSNERDHRDLIREAENGPTETDLNDKIKNGASEGGESDGPIQSVGQMDREESSNTTPGDNPTAEIESRKVENSMNGDTDIDRQTELTASMSTSEPKSLDFSEEKASKNDTSPPPPPSQLGLNECVLAVHLDGVNSEVTKGLPPESNPADLPIAGGGDVPLNTPISLPAASQLQVTLEEDEEEDIVNRETQLRTSIDGNVGQEAVLPARVAAHSAAEVEVEELVETVTDGTTLPIDDPHNDVKNCNDGSDEDEVEPVEPSNASARRREDLGSSSSRTPRSSGVEASMEPSMQTRELTPSNSRDPDPTTSSAGMITKPTTSVERAQDGGKTKSSINEDMIKCHPTFNSIFSHFYQGSGNEGADGWAGGNDKGGRVRSTGHASAAAEKATMEKTWRLYVQWQQVMRDYADVFSTDVHHEEEDGNRDSRGCSGGGGGGGGASGLVYEGSASALQYRVNSSTRSEVYDIVTEAIASWAALGDGVIEAKDAKGGAPRDTTGLAAATTSNNSVVYDAEWVELPNGLGLGTTWNLLWTWSKPRIDYSSLLVWQRVNHFPRSRELTRKDLLKRNIGKMESLCAGSKQHNTAFNIMPVTFILPHEYTKFIAAFYEIEQEREEVVKQGGRPLPNFWILKPVGLSRGRGISLISEVGAVKYDTQTVVQHYLRNPLLIDGYKWDLRLYVLVTSFQPLEAFIYREGFVRLSTRKFDMSAEKQSDLFVHLTNSSIQKNSEGTKVMGLSPTSQAKAKERGGILHVRDGEENEGELGGTKRTLQWLWRTLVEMGRLRQDDRPQGAPPSSSSSSRGVAASANSASASASPSPSPQKSKHGAGSGAVPSLADLWASIEEVVLKALLCVDGEIANQPNSFELFGYDVILDDDLRPWILEVNASPSMARETELDRRIKDVLIRDTVALVDPLPFDRAALVKIIERRHQNKNATSRKASGSIQMELARDLNAVLKGRKPRQVGEAPRFTGGYEFLAPGTPAYSKCMKIKAAISTKARGESMR